VEYFGEDVLVLYNGEAMGHRRASFEIPGLVADADAVINHFCMLAETLPERERAIWNHCSKRVFDIGFESGTHPRAFQSEIRPKTIERVAALGAGIVVTIYSPSPDQEGEGSDT
jgi:hypothetical protein